MSTYTEWLKDLWRYRELFYFLAWRDIKVRYKQTVFGVVWAVIQPLISMLVFTLLFGKFAQLPHDGVPYPIFYFSALLPWTYFAATLTLSGNSLVNDTNLITKVYFPRLILPASAAIGGLVDFGIGFVLLIGIITYYGAFPDWQILFWPVLVFLLLTLSLGVGMILAAVNVKYRDVKYVLPFAVQLLLFATPVIYPTSIIPEQYRFLAALNPLSGIIEAFRATLSPVMVIDWQLLGTSAVVTVCIFTLGTIYFRNTERSFADVV